MTDHNDDLRLVENSLLYKMFARQRDEILRYKWIESEKAGVDIGFEKALLGWLVKKQRELAGAAAEQPWLKMRFVDPRSEAGVKYLGR